jgi:hypothetical protein
MLTTFKKYLVKITFSSDQAKLDGYRADFQRGKELNEDQKLAISKYEEVLQNLDFARELSGQVNVTLLEKIKNLM